MTDSIVLSKNNNNIDNKNRMMKDSSLVFLYMGETAMRNMAALVKEVPPSK